MFVVKNDLLYISVYNRRKKQYKCLLKSLQIAQIRLFSCFY